MSSLENGHLLSEMWVWERLWSSCILFRQTTLPWASTEKLAGSFYYYILISIQNDKFHDDIFKHASHTTLLMLFPYSASLPRLPPNTFCLAFILYMNVYIHKYFNFALHTREHASLSLLCLHISAMLLSFNFLFLVVSVFIEPYLKHMYICTQTYIHRNLCTQTHSCTHAHIYTHTNIYMHCHT